MGTPPAAYFALLRVLRPILGPTVSCSWRFPPPCTSGTPPAAYFALPSGLLCAARVLRRFLRPRFLISWPCSGHHSALRAIDTTYDPQIGSIRSILFIGAGPGRHSAFSITLICIGVPFTHPIWSLFRPLGFTLCYPNYLSIIGSFCFAHQRINPSFPSPNVFSRPTFRTTRSVSSLCVSQSGFLFLDPLLSVVIFCFLHIFTAAVE